MQNLTKIYCSIPTLFSEGVMHLTAARMQLDHLKTKAPREFNRRVKERAQQAIKIEPAPLLEFTQAEEPVICRRMTREEFEAEYA